MSPYAIKADNLVATTAYTKLLKHTKNTSNPDITSQFQSSMQQKHVELVVTSQQIPASKV